MQYARLLVLVVVSSIAFGNYHMYLVLVKMHRAHGRNGSLAGADAGIDPSGVTIQITPSNIEANANIYDLKTVVCLQPSLKYFCGLILLAKDDPVVAKLYDPLTVATVFAPTDRVRHQFYIGSAFCSSPRSIVTSMLASAPHARASTTPDGRSSE